MSVGQNTIKGQELLAFVERVERVDKEKKELTADRAAILAEAKAAGFLPAAIAHCVKVRAMKPHDRQEMEAVRDTYLHAIGLGDPPPLFRMMNLMQVDQHSRESVLDALEKIVPAKGDVILRVGGEPVRLWRDKDGAVQREPWAEPAYTVAPAPKPREAKAKNADPVLPDLDSSGAFDLGREYARQNKAVIENPFPFGDPRRARFDEGWRKEAGGDGMGPDEG